MKITLTPIKAGATQYLVLKGSRTTLKINGPTDCDVTELQAAQLKKFAEGRYTIEIKEPSPEPPGESTATNEKNV